MTTRYQLLIKTKLGWLELRATSKGVSSIAFLSKRPKLFLRPNARLKALAGQIGQYLGGKRRAFQFKPDVLGTPFQKKVWAKLQRIPYRKTVSYEAIARAMGRPKATRAVANAVGRNPLSILIPCHRVIRKNGLLGGYAAGLWRKKILLKTETYSVKDSL